MWSLYVCIRLQQLKNRKGIKIEGIFRQQYDSFPKKQSKSLFISK